jgi:polysaccharide export outer membrane protein
MKKLVFLFGLILAGTAWAAAEQPQATNQDAQAARDVFVKAYRIGPGDLLEIKVFELEQLSQVVRVSEDGSITLPLLGRVEVEGLTQDGTAAKIAGLLAAKYVKNPQVTVFIKEYKSKQVAVIGAVEKPGSYELVGRKNLLQVISAAGGFTDQATDEIYVLREGPDGGTSTIAVDLKDLLINGNQKLNIPIEPNDVINIPVDREIKVFVFGRVTQPGALKFKISEKVTLLKAIAQAGGWAEGAKQSAVVITRKDKSGKETQIRVNVKDIISGKRKDIPLMEGDVVFVPESFW